MSKPANVTLARNPWRFVCPRGHHTVKKLVSRDDEWVCRTCRFNDHDPYWTGNQLVDKREQARADDGTWCGP